MSSNAAKRCFFLAVLLGVLYVAGWQYYASLAIAGKSGNLVRNPWFRRNWPEFVKLSSSVRKSGKRLVFLGNSQTYGKEVTASECFPSIVSRKLGNRVDALNWGVPGGRIIDLIILAAAAGNAAPDCLVIGVNLRMFNTGDLRKSSSDIHYLLLSGNVSLKLSRDFLSTYASAETAIDLAIWKLYPVYRIREIPLDAFFLEFPILLEFSPKRRSHWFNDLTSHGRMNDFVRRLSFVRKLKPRWEKNIEHWPPAGKSPRIRMKVKLTSVVRSNIRFFSEVLKKSGARGLVYLHPLDFEEFYENGEDEKNLIQALSSACTDSGYVFRDLRTCVGLKFFIAKRHFSQEGHRLFADILAPLIEPIVFRNEKGRTIH